MNARPAALGIEVHQDSREFFVEAATRIGLDWEEGARRDSTPLVPVRGESVFSVPISP